MKRLLPPPPTAPAEGLDLLTDQDAAAILAVEPRTLRLWRATRGLPFIRITPRVIRYRRGDLSAWVARRAVRIG